MDEKKINSVAKIMAELFSSGTPHESVDVLCDVIMNFIMASSKPGCTLPALESLFKVIKVRMVEA